MKVKMRKTMTMGMNIMVTTHKQYEDEFWRVL